MFQVQVNDNAGVLKELVWIGLDREVAERKFLATCSTEISNFDEYSPEDISEVLDNGFESYGNGTVMLIDTSNCRTDEELVTEIGGFIPPDVEQVEEWHSCGEIGEVNTISEIIENAGECLDSANSWDICGEVLFKAGGKWYVGTTQFVLSEASEEYLKDSLDNSGQ